MATSQQLAAAGLRSIDNTACTGSALDLGATVTSWRPRGGPEVLFLSRDALVGEGQEIHGGIPICAPWFGHGRDDVEVPRPHGLVRWVPWHFVDETVRDGATTLVWELTGPDIAHLPGAEDYPADIWFRYEATFGETLRLALTQGSESTSFVLDEALHSYFSVSGIDDVTIVGLAGQPFRDYTRDQTWHVSGDELSVAGPTDRIYDGAGSVSIRDAATFRRLRSTGASSTVVWNPGPDGAETLTGWAADEWQSMVCVEVGNIQHNAVTVPAGGSHTLTLEISSGPLA